MLVVVVVLLFFFRFFDLFEGDRLRRLSIILSVGCNTFSVDVVRWWLISVSVGHRIPDGVDSWANVLLKLHRR